MAAQPNYLGPQQTEQRSAGLTLNLSSNNPFRNRAASPSSLQHSPVSPFDDPVPPPRPVSRNPFLDPNHNNSSPNLRLLETMTSKNETTSPTAEELFDSLTIEDKKSPPPQKESDGARPPPVNRRPGPPRGENIPPGRRGPPPNHRPTRSQEEALRARRMQGNSGSGLLGASPPKKTMERRRRNSESSVMDEKPLTEDQKKARDLRRRERERRHREGKDKKPSKKLDVIDQLDATSLFGTSIFHHDGPFDAVNPHRNRKGRRNAPMQAFPQGSLNNSIGGSGPLNKRPDHAVFMGNGDEEAFKDYATGSNKAQFGDNYATGQERKQAPVFDPLARGSVVYGEETEGLGASTFLEGTPAARSAIQRREAERAQDPTEGGLQRKKSLAQRIRNINRTPRDYQGYGPRTNPDGTYYASRRSPTEGPATGTPVSAGERNPFFNEYDGKQEELISVKKTDSNEVQSPMSPNRGYGLERRATTDALGSDEPQQKQGGGLLARVKSLKGGRGKRGQDFPPTPAPPTPGTAV